MKRSSILSHAALFAVLCIPSISFGMDSNNMNEAVKQFYTQLFTEPTTVNFPKSNLTAFKEAVRTFKSDAQDSLSVEMLNKTQTDITQLLKNKDLSHKQRAVLAAARDKVKEAIAQKTADTNATKSEASVETPKTDSVPQDENKDGSSEGSDNEKTDEGFITADEPETSQTTPAQKSNDKQPSDTEQTDTKQQPTKPNPAPTPSNDGFLRTYVLTKKTGAAAVVLAAGAGAYYYYAHFMNASDDQIAPEAA